MSMFNWPGLLQKNVFVWEPRALASDLNFLPGKLQLEKTVTGKNSTLDGKEFDSESFSVEFFSSLVFSVWSFPVKLRLDNFSRLHYYFIRYNSYRSTIYR